MALLLRLMRADCTIAGACDTAASLLLLLLPLPALALLSARYAAAAPSFAHRHTSSSIPIPTAHLLSSLLLFVLRSALLGRGHGHAPPLARLEVLLGLRRLLALNGRARLGVVLQVLLARLVLVEGVPDGQAEEGEHCY
jgi:hypothetical protein